MHDHVRVNHINVTWKLSSWHGDTIGPLPAIFLGCDFHSLRLQAKIPCS